MEFVTYLFVCHVAVDHSKFLIQLLFLEFPFIEYRPDGVHGVGELEGTNDHENNNDSILQIVYSGQ